MDRSTPVATETESIWTVDDVAARLRVTRNWVYVACESGRLPFYRVGKFLRFVPSEIAEYLRQQRVR